MTQFRIQQLEVIERIKSAQHTFKARENATRHNQVFKVGEKAPPWATIWIHGTHLVIFDDRDMINDTLFINYGSVQMRTNAQHL